MNKIITFVADPHIGFTHFNISKIRIVDFDSDNMFHCEINDVDGNTSCPILHPSQLYLLLSTVEENTPLFIVDESSLEENDYLVEYSNIISIKVDVSDASYSVEFNNKFTYSNSSQNWYGLTSSKCNKPVYYRIRLRVGNDIIKTTLMNLPPHAIRRVLKKLYKGCVILSIKRLKS